MIECEHGSNACGLIQLPDTTSYWTVRVSRLVPFTYQLEYHCLSATILKYDSISLWLPFGRSLRFVSASFSSYKFPSPHQKMVKMHSFLKNLLIFHLIQFMVCTTYHYT